MFFYKLRTPTCVKNLLAQILGLSLLAFTQFATAGEFTSDLNDFSFEATGPMGLGRATVATTENNGYQMVNSKVSIVASQTQQSNVLITYDVNIQLVEGVLTNTIDATGTVTFYFDVLITDVDSQFDFYGQADGGTYQFNGIEVIATLQHISTDAGVAHFVLDATGTDVTKDLNGVSLALNVDVNGIDEHLATIDATQPGLEGYLDVIKFKSNEFLTALTNMNLTLADGIITYDPTPAVLSGGVQDDYLDPEFSFLMIPKSRFNFAACCFLL